MTLGAVAGSARRAAPATPANIVGNSAFSDTSAWLGQGVSGLSISAGKGHYASTPAFNGLYQNVTLVNGKYYEVAFTISSFTSGSIRAGFAGSGTVRTGNGTYTERILAGATTTTFNMQTTTAGTTLDIDDVTAVGPYNTATVGGA